MTSSTRRALGVIVSVIIGATGLAACGSSGEGDGGGGGPKVGLILHSLTVPRYENKDKPYFEAALEEECPDCTLIYANAADDSSKQLQQAQSMLSQGVDVLVIDSVDGVASASIVSSAKAKDVPVVSYDRPIESPDVAFAVANDYYQVGVLEAKSLVQRLGELGVAPGDGGIVVNNGDQNDQGSIDIKTGVHSVLDKSEYKIIGEMDSWDADKAHDYIAGQITKYGKDIVAVYAPNDTNAAAAIAAFKAAGWKKLPPITGLDASLGGIQNIVAGDQYMTIYNPFRDEAQHAAAGAVALANGEEPPANKTIKGIPTYMTTPQVVTIDNIEDTVVKDEFWTVEEICTKEYAKACQAAGLS